MTPKEKAKELVDKFRKEFDWVESQYAIDLYRDTRQCALIAVDEIKEFMSPMVNSKQAYDYWDEVKQEIEKL
jgi:hypothetical protein